MLPRAKEIVEAAGLKMQDAVDFLEEDLKNYRVGKATPAIFNGVTVDYYGTPTPLNQVASITTPDAKTIAIQPWERNMISKIEKAILDANVGLTPSNNGEIIRCVVPALTEERRRELIKKAKAQGETTKVTVRNARRDGIDLLKKAQKNEGLSRRTKACPRTAKKRARKSSRRSPTSTSRRSMRSSPRRRKKFSPSRLGF